MSSKYTASIVKGPRMFRNFSLKSALSSLALTLGIDWVRVAEQAESAPPIEVHKDVPRGGYYGKRYRFGGGRREGRREAFIASYNKNPMNFLPGSVSKNIHDHSQPGAWQAKAWNWIDAHDQGPGSSGHRIRQRMIDAAKAAA